tara:strand:+ start:9300 stop:9833 length:534 start_codon:yes stop_codon:yes gene_type:complete
MKLHNKLPNQLLNTYVFNNITKYCSYIDLFNSLIATCKDTYSSIKYSQHSTKRRLQIQIKIINTIIYHFNRKNKLYSEGPNIKNIKLLSPEYFKINIEQIANKCPEYAYIFIVAIHKMDNIIKNNYNLMNIDTFSIKELQIIPRILKIETKNKYNSYQYTNNTNKITIHQPIALSDI